MNQKVTWFRMFSKLLKRHVNDIMPYPLKYQNWQQEVASCDAMVCTNMELENNTQINIKFNPCMNILTPQQTVTLYFTILMWWGLNFCNGKVVEVGVPKCNHTHDAIWCGWMLVMTAIGQCDGVTVTSFTRTRSSGGKLGVALSHRWRCLSDSVDRLGGVLCQHWLLKTL